MSKESQSGSPFYDDKHSLVIYDDKIVLPGLKNREIKFDDVRDIYFRKIDFALYSAKSKTNTNYISICLKGGAVIDIKVSLKGYYVLKNYYEKGSKSDGTLQITITNIISIILLIVFLILIYIYVLH